MTTASTPLDNIAWHALIGAQAGFAAGRGGARRFAAGYSPILGFEDRRAPDFEALTGFCETGESFYCLHWTGPVPPGWCVEVQAAVRQMVCAPTPPDIVDPIGLRPLGVDDVAQAMALARLTRPGPFGPRTIELGEYFGVFDGGRLVAMAGERMAAGRLREVSGVCTHPDARGQGLARRLVAHLLARQHGRGLTSFLHVMADNPPAIRLYESLGFASRSVDPVRVVRYL